MKLQATNYNLQAQLGFTLVESLVAITILIFGVLGPMTVATRGITDGFYAQNQLIATHLAQEGLELLSTQVANNNKPINGTLDKNLSGGSPDIDDLLYGLGACKGLPCAVVITSSGDFTFSPCDSPNDCQIAYRPGTGFYEKYDGSNASSFAGPVFTRTIMVDTLIAVGVSEVLLSSKVEWTNKPTSPLQNVKLTRYAFHAVQ